MPRRASPLSLKPGGHLIVNRDVTKLYPYLPFEEVVGFKNEEAAMAAVKYFDKTALQIQQALATFRSAPHRIEWVKDINGVSFYNDSKATNVDSVLYALKSMRGPIYLIAGGKHKGTPYTAWKPQLEEKVEKMYLLGRRLSRWHRSCTVRCRSTFRSIWKRL